MCFYMTRCQISLVKWLLAVNDSVYLDKIRPTLTILETVLVHGIHFHAPRVYDFPFGIQWTAQPIQSLARSTRDFITNRFSGNSTLQPGWINCDRFVALWAREEMCGISEERIRSPSRVNEIREFEGKMWEQSDPLKLEISWKI